MTRTRGRTGAGWAWLLALPVLCCGAHALLLALGAGTVTAVLAGVTGDAVLAVAGASVLLPAAVVLVRRRGR